MSILGANSQIMCRDIYVRGDQQQQVPSSGNFLFAQRSLGSNFWVDRRNKERKRVSNSRRELRVEAGFWADLSRPTTVEMEAIVDTHQLDKILLQAKELSQPILIDWMAAWCRKCIYLKPKLEKLAADFDTKIKFYYVDVNKVPKSLVERGNISKMPTIQIWKDGEMKAEVIGGHMAWLVVDEVREMIQKFV